MAIKAGYVHVYCGDGKGKTTACVGLAIRAISHDWRVLFAQFLKSGQSGELRILEQTSLITVMSGSPVKQFSWKLNEAERLIARTFYDDRLRLIHQQMLSGTYDLIVLDEVLGAISAGLADEAIVLQILDECPKTCEIVLSGRSYTAEILKRADYVSKIAAVKHPYTQGVVAREGIEY